MLNLKSLLHSPKANPQASRQEDRGLRFPLWRGPLRVARIWSEMLDCLSPCSTLPNPRVKAWTHQLRPEKCGRGAADPRVPERTPGKAIKWSKTVISKAETSSSERTAQVVFLTPDLLSQMKANSPEQRTADRRVGYFIQDLVPLARTDLLSGSLAGSVNNFQASTTPLSSNTILPSRLPLPLLWSVRDLPK